MVCLRCQKCSWRKDLNLCLGQKTFKLVNCSLEKFMNKSQMESNPTTGSMQKNKPA